MVKMIMTEQEILAACKRLAEQLDERLKDEEKIPVIICTLKGAMHFVCDLTKQMKTPLIMDYIRTKSYSGPTNTGQITFIHDVETDLTGRTVVIVDEVLDSGKTIKFLKEHFSTNHKPKEIISVVLLDKKNARKVPVEADYVGKYLEDNDYINGYGCDYYEVFRNLPYVYQPDDDDFARMDKLIKDKQ